MSEEEFADSVRAELSADDETDAEVYERAMPFWQSYAGLKRYWANRGQGEE
jgi:hypothetical protein